MKNNLLIVGATSGIMVSCLESFLEKKYKITATYSKEESLLNGKTFFVTNGEILISFCFNNFSIIGFITLSFLNILIAF